MECREPKKRKRVPITKKMFNKFKEEVMAELDNLKSAVSALQTQVALTVTEIAALKAAQGGVPAADVQAAADAVNVEVGKLQGA